MMARKHLSLKKGTVYIVILLFLVVTQLPIYWMYITSFKTQDEIYGNPTWFPHSFTLQNYKDVTSAKQGRNFVFYIRNSLGISSIVTLLMLIIGTGSAYVFSHLRFRGSGVLLFLIIASRVIPPISLVIPYFKIAEILRLRDTWFVLIWVDVYLYLPFAVWLLKGFFDTIPFELSESAKVDGCNNVQAFAKVVLPNALPGIASAGTLVFLLSWNHFLFPLVLSTTIKAKTIPVGLYDYVGDYFVNWGNMAAAGVIASIPAIIFLSFFSRWLVSGLLAGAMKQ
ncbi:MAG: carbohydrate ABC transporter permease [bacterium]